MIKALIYLALAAAVTVGLAWFADRPGEVIIRWADTQIEMSLYQVVVLFMLAIAVLLFTARLLRKLFMGPGRVRRKWRQKRIDRGYAALRKGMFAVGAGDETLAIRNASDARRALPNEPLTQLLLAQAAQLSGDRRTAQRIFEAMVDETDTKLLGLHGLFLEASNEKQMEAAQQYAARAMALNPQLSWAVHSLFDMQCQNRDWQGALDTLAIARNNRHVDKKTAERRRAVLLTAQAADLAQTQPERAAELALEAHKIVPGFVPAAHIAGRLLADRGQSYKATSVIARTWQYSPHPDLAAAYAYLLPGDSPRDRLARIRSLIVMAPDHVEARVALARAAADAREWEEARDALLPLIAGNPSARVCALMARIEGGEKRDAGRVREWLTRAVRAPRDATWIADGVSSDVWSPISPVTGKLDAFVWQIPDDRSQRRAGADDGLMDEINALSRELETIPRVDPAPVASPVAETQVMPPMQPITITVTAVETPPTIKPVEAVIVKETPPKAAMNKPEKVVTSKKVEAKIFVPDRPPDDPGPSSDPADVDETSTAIGRFRTASKAK